MDTCFLDDKSTDEINKQFRKWYPVRYKEPIVKLTQQRNKMKLKGEDGNTYEIKFGNIDTLREEIKELLAGGKQKAK